MSPKSTAIVLESTSQPEESLRIDSGSHNVCLKSLPLQTQGESKSAILAGLTATELARLATRFWAKVDKRGACWLWTSSRSRKYGTLSLTANGKFYLFSAHRVAWFLTHGSLDPILEVCHHCDNPPCVNPAHLFQGTTQDNLDDARHKGRLIDGRGARVLTDAAYHDILTTKGRGTGIALAKKYGVSHITISRIRNGHQGSLYRQGYRMVVPHRLPSREVA